MSSYLSENERLEIIELQKAEIREKLPDPIIRELKIIGDSVYDDQNINIRWNVENCSKVVINEHYSSLASGSYELLPGTTQIRFKAINEEKYRDGTPIGKQVEKILNIELFKTPQIFYKCDKYLIRKGKENIVKFSWCIRNATKAYLLINEKKENLVLDKRGEKELILSDECILRIEIVGLDRKRIFSDERKIEARYESKLNDFSVDKRYSFEKVPFDISWDVEYAKKVYLTGGLGDVIADKLPMKGMRKIYFERDETITLNVEDNFGILKSKIDLYVLPTPYIRHVCMPVPQIKGDVHLTVKLNRPVIYGALKVGAVEYSQINTRFLKMQRPTNQIQYTSRVALKKTINTTKVKTCIKNITVIVSEILKVFNHGKH